MAFHTGTPTLHIQRHPPADQTAAAATYALTPPAQPTAGFSYSMGDGHPSHPLVWTVAHHQHQHPFGSGAFVAGDARGQPQQPFGASNPPYGFVVAMDAPQPLMFTHHHSSNLQHHQQQHHSGAAYPTFSPQHVPIYSHDQRQGVAAPPPLQLPPGHAYQAPPPHTISATAALVAMRQQHPLATTLIQQRHHHHNNRQQPPPQQQQHWTEIHARNPPPTFAAPAAQRSSRWVDVKVEGVPMPAAPPAYTAGGAAASPGPSYAALPVMPGSRHAAPLLFGPAGTAAVAHHRHQPTSGEFNATTPPSCPTKGLAATTAPGGVAPLRGAPPTPPGAPRRSAPQPAPEGEPDGVDGDPRGPRQIIVTGLATAVAAADVEKAFERWRSGSVDRVNLPLRRSGHHRGYAFVYLVDRDTAVRAIAEMGGDHTLSSGARGAGVKLQWANQKTPSATATPPPAPPSQVISPPSTPHSAVAGVSTSCTAVENITTGTEARLS